MNNTNNHMIKRVCWHAGLPGRREAIDLQNRISDWSNNKLPALSDMVFDQVSIGNGVICIPSLELDLGHIALANLEQGLNDVFARALKDALTRYMMSSGLTHALDNNTPYITTETQRQSDILISLFENGYLPWNYSEKMGTAVEMVDYVLTNEPAYFIDVLKDHTRTNRQITKRIAHQIPEKQLSSILTKAVPGNATEILAYKQQTECIHKEERQINITETELNTELWNWILDYVLTEHSSTFNRKAFMRGMIKRIAGQQNVDYYDLLNSLDTAIHTIRKKQKVHSDFLATFELVRSEDLHIEKTITKEANTNEPAVNTEQIAESHTEHKWIALEHCLTGQPHKASESVNLKSLVTELWKLDKKRLAHLIKELSATESNEKQMLAKFDDISIDELATMLCDAPPAIPGKITDLIANALRDAGIYIGPAELRNNYLSYLLKTTTNVADETALLKYVLAATARQTNKTIAEIAANIVTEGYKYVPSTFGNHALDEIKGIYRNTINGLPEPQLSKQIELLLTAVTHNKTKNTDALQALLQIVANERPQQFYNYLINADENTIKATLALMDTDTLLLIFDNISNWPAKLSSKLATIKKANESSATIAVLINDITRSAFHVLRQQSISGTPHEPDDSIAEAELHSFTKHRCIEYLCTKRDELQTFLINNIDQKGSLLQLKKLAAGWVSRIAEKAGLSKAAVEKSLAKLIESFWRKNPGNSTWHSNISELITGIILHFGIKGENAQQLFEIARRSTQAATGDKIRDTKAEDFDQLALVADELLKESLGAEPHLDVDTVHAVQIFAEQYPIHAARAIVKMNSNNLARLSTSAVSFPHYCQALSMGHANALAIRYLAGHYNFFKVLIGAGMPQHLKLKYWTSLRALLDRNTSATSYLSELTKAAVQVFAGMRHQNKDEVAWRIKNNFGSIPAWLKTMLPVELVQGIQQMETPGDKAPEAEYKNSTDSALAAPLLYYAIRRRGLPSRAPSGETFAGIEVLIEQHPFALYLLLKYYALTKSELLWLYKKTGCSTLSNAITKVAPGARGQLEMAGIMYSAFTHVPTSKQLNYILWQIIADAWINNKLTTLSPTAVWQGILQKAALNYNIPYKQLAEELQAIRYKLPPVYKLSLEHLIKQNRMNQKPVRDEKVSKQATLISDTGVLVNNAGLVLLNNYLRLLFIRLNLISDDKFISKNAQEKAVHCLQFLCTGQLTAPEHLLVLNKVMCGMAIEEPIATSAEISQDEQQLMEGLINNMIAHWPQCGCNSTDGFRGTWFIRNGIVKKHEKKWHLIIDREHRKPYDLLLDRSPFSFSVINYPWMEFPLYVDWITH